MTGSGRVRFPRPVLWLTTAGTPRQEWLQAREGGIGGSELSAILGTSPFATGWALWAQRTGLIDREPPDRERMRWGAVLEDSIARRWADVHGATIRRVGMVADPDRPWRRASLDRVVLHPGTLRAGALLECKATSERSGDLDEDALQARYAAQVQWYLGITGLPAAHLAVLIGGQELRTFPVEHDEQEFERLGAAVDRFWHDHLQPGSPPPPLVPADAAWTARIGQDGDAPPAIAGPDLLDLLSVRPGGVAELRFWEDSKDLLDAAVKAHMGPATELLDPDGRVLFTFREQTKTVVDGRRLKAERPDVWQEYARTTRSRVLRAKDKETTHE